MKTTAGCILALVSLLVLISASAAVTVTVTLSPVANNMIYSNSNNTNEPSSFFNVGEDTLNNVEFRTLMKFDLSSIPAGATIDSARLNIFPSQPVSGNTEIAVYAVPDSWVPTARPAALGTGQAPVAGEPTWTYSSFNTDKWADDGVVSNAAAALLSATLVDTEGSDATLTTNWNTPAFLTQVRSWTTTNNGIVIVGKTADRFARFYAKGSSETAKRPNLSITYTTTTPVTPPTNIVNFAPPPGIGGTRYRATSGNSAAIVGGVVGGVMALVLIIAIINIVLRS